jgi:UDP-glucose 4-epimerase
MVASKWMVKELLKDLANSEPQWSIALLRYFNPVGAHQSGLNGEATNRLPNNLLPYVSELAIGKLQQLWVFGADYPTQDGTGVRDYIHVQDLADGHLNALRTILQKTGVNIWNQGTGIGYSVLEMIRAFEEASGRAVPYKLVERRPGAIAEAGPTPQKLPMNYWKAKCGLPEMMADIWRMVSRKSAG